MIEFAKNENENKIVSKIIPIASGKGGVGKSMLSVNLGICLALRGFKTLIVDLDFGCANIHTYLGVKNRERCLSDHLNKKNIHLSHLPIATNWEGLDVIIGEQHVPDSANIGPSMRKRIIDELYELDYNFVILDLGASNHANSLDFFLLSNQGIMVTVPSHGAILNAYSFLKSIIFRLFVLNFPEVKYKRLINQIKKRDDIGKYPTFWDLLNDIATIDFKAAEEFKKDLERFKPLFMFNMVENKDDTEYMKELFRLIYEKLIIEPEMLGYLPMLDEVHKSIKLRKPFSGNGNHADTLLNKMADIITAPLYETSPLFDPTKYGKSINNLELIISSDLLINPIVKDFPELSKNQILQNNLKKKYVNERLKRLQKSKRSK